MKDLLQGDRAETEKDISEQPDERLRDTRPVDFGMMVRAPSELRTPESYKRRTEG